MDGKSDPCTEVLVTSRKWQDIAITRAILMSKYGRRRRRRCGGLGNEQSTFMYIYIFAICMIIIVNHIIVYRFCLLIDFYLILGLPYPSQFGMPLPLLSTFPLHIVNLTRIHFPTISYYLTWLSSKGLIRKENGEGEMTGSVTYLFIDYWFRHSYIFSLRSTISILWLRL